MKQRAHAWTALRAFKLLEDSGKAQKLVELLSYYLSDVWEGAWLPDTLIIDMQYGHIYKMDSDPGIVGEGVSEERMAAPYKVLGSRLKGKRLCLEHVKDEPELNKPYRSHPEKGGHLPNRVIALSQTIGDMLKMSDYPVAFYSKEQKPKAFRQGLTAQKIKDLSLSPNFSARQIAITFFMLTHYICDAHMPLHCDMRDYGTGKARRLPKTLHPSIEEEWEKHFPEKETLTLHGQFKKSIDEIVVKSFPKDSIIKVDKDANFSLSNQIPTIAHDEWKEMVFVARVSYALSRNWLNKDYKDATEIMESMGKENFARITNYVFHDAIQSIASIWLKAWQRFVL